MALDILKGNSSVRLSGSNGATETLEEKIRKARALGYSEADIAKVMGTEGVQPPTPQPQAKDTSLQRTLLTTGGSILGGIGGGLVGGPVGLIAGGALGASAGEGAYQALTPEDDTDISKVAKEGLTSGALDLATLGLFKAAKTAPALLKLLKGAKAAEGVAEAGVKTAAKTAPAGVGKEVTENVIQKLGKKVTEYGDDYMMKGFGKSQILTALEKKHGKFTDVLNKYPALIRGNVDEYGKVTAEAQKAFDDIALRSGAKVDKAVLQDEVMKTAKELYDTKTSTGIAAAEKMIDEFSIFEKQIGDNLDVKDATLQRGVYDDYIKKFQVGDANKGVYQNLREAFQNAIRKSTKGLTSGGKDLKQLGQDLNKLYGFQDYFESASNIGKTGKPMGLIDAVMAGAGGATGFVSGGPAGALAGAALPALTQKAINSPKGVKMVSDLIKKAGEKTTQAGARLGAESVEGGMKATSGLTKKNLGAIALLGGGANLARSGSDADTAGVEEALMAAQGGAQPTPTAQPQYVDRGEYVTDTATNEHFSKDLTRKFNKQTQQWEDNIESGASSQGLSKESIVQQMVQDLQITGGKNIAKLETIMKALERVQGGGGTMSDTKAKELVTAETALKQLDSLEKGFATSSGEMTGAGPLLGKAFSSLPFATSASGLDAQARLAAQTIGVALEGGKLTDADILRYQQHIIPNAGDSKKKAQQKIDNLRMLLNTRLEELKKTRSVSDYSKGEE